MTYFLSRDGVKIWYEFDGSGRDTVIFLHGLTGSLSAWKETSEIVKKRGHSILLIDLRGHGLSDKPEQADKLNISQIARDIVDIADHEGIRKATVIGHCYGAFVSMEVYKNSPGLVDKMVLISPHYKITKDSNFKPWSIYYLYKVLSYMCTPLRFENNKVHVDYRKFSKSFDIDMFRILKDISVTSFRTILPLYKELLGLDYEDLLSTIRVPLIIIHGKNDLFFHHNTAYEFKGHIPAADVRLIDSGHLPPITNSKEIAEYIA